MNAALIAGRYRLGRIIGEGGMGVVHEAVDESNGRALALKRLLIVREPQREQLTALFQREYRTLSGLKHPSVVEVYDYGIDEVGPFYTMELLAGDDLRSLLPLPYVDVCTLLREVASALCLLHTRRLVHRDITSRNIRVVSPTHAKILDFGALAPMGYCGPVVGTAPFVAPEAFFSQPLDPRSDLFSLGVVLYQSLAGALPYRGRTLDQVRAAWQSDIPTVRDLVPDVPLELSQLVMSLIAPDRSARPRDAAQVFEQLSAIAGLPGNELPGTARAYLIAPNLVGRDAGLQHVRDALAHAQDARGEAVMITGPAGVGRSRLLQATALEATVAGATVLSAGPSQGDGGAFSVAQRLAESLIQTLPALAETAARECWEGCRVLFSDQAASAALPPLVQFATLTRQRADVMAAMREWLFCVSRDRLLVITVDDVTRIDEPSAAWLGTLVQEVPSHRVVVITSACDVDRNDWTPAVRLLCELSHELRLNPFRPDQVSELVTALFGSTPNIDTVSKRVHALSQGIARDAVTLCEELVDAGVVSYRGGTWLLPPTLDGHALPESMAAAHAQVVKLLSPEARYLARVLALTTKQFVTFQDCVGVAPQLSQHVVGSMLEELSLHGVVSTDGYRYSIQHDGWTHALLHELSHASATELHLALAAFYRTRRPDPLRLAHHLLLGSKELDGLATLLPFIRALGDQRLDLLEQTTLSAPQLGALFTSAIEAAERLRQPPSELAALQYFMMMLGLFADVSWFEALRPHVVDGLLHDSGYRIWQQQDPGMSALNRTLAALQGAQAEFERTPPEQRRLAPEQAIRALVQFTGAAMAVGAQICDWPLRRSLPDLLRPFVFLSPLIKVMLENTLSVTELSFGRYERYRDRSLAVRETLSDPAVQSLEHLEEIRSAVTYGVSSAEARLGDVRALQRLSTLEQHPRLRCNAMDLQAYVYLQQGDWARAKVCKRKVEQLNLESTVGQMFGSSNLRNELEVYALGGDLGAVKHSLLRLEALATKHPGWLPSVHAGRGEYERLRGDMPAALEAFEQALTLLEPLMTPEGGVAEWYSAVAGKVSVLVDMERHEDARQFAETALTRAGSWSTDGVVEARVHGIMSALALAESGLGQHERALERLNVLIRARLALATSGIYLGVVYEARAQVACASGDAALHQESVRLACEQLSLCDDSGFASRRQRLLGLGRKGEQQSADSAPDDAASMSVTVSSGSRVDPETRVSGADRSRSK